jgi:glycerophosphoryl diester phosphodiesterase
MFKNNNIKVFGHRGAAGLEFENTLAGIQLALDHKVDGIEIDVWKTIDDEIVVFHDAYLDRLTESEGWIFDMHSDKLGNVKLKNGDRIPKLIEVIQLIKNNKYSVTCRSEIENALEQTIKLLQAELEPSNYIVGSFYHEVIKDCKKSNFEIQTAIMFECVPYLLDDYLKKINADYIISSIETYNQYLVDTVKIQGESFFFIQ